MWLLYQAGIALTLALAGPFLLARRGRHYLETLPGRLGRYPSNRPPSARGGLWLHAVSVGEVAVAATLAHGLPPASRPRLVTTVTPTGQARARALFGEAAAAYLPFDLGFAVRRFFERFQPAALVLSEGDYWPLVLREARRRRLPVAVVNGRVSERSFRRMLRIKRWLGPLLGAVDRFGVQTGADRDRLLALGVAAERVTVTGNLKYDTPEPALDPGLAERIRRLAAGRPILVAGSTMAGSSAGPEEAQVAEAFERLGSDRALLVLAPRHPERWDEVERLLGQRGLRTLRRSRFEAGIDRPDAGRSAGESSESSRSENDRSESDGAAEADVLLLDSMGELAAVYQLADAAFIGGTLVATGGHNPLEPAVFGVPIVVGPSMHHFQEIAATFDATRAWLRVKDAAGLAEAWRRILDAPRADGRGARGRALIEANRGATARTLELLAPLLARVLEAEGDDAQGAAT